MTARRGRPGADRSGTVRLCGLWLPARIASAVRERAAALSRPIADVLAACVVVGLAAGPAIVVHPGTPPARESAPAVATPPPVVQVAAPPPVPVPAPSAPTPTPDVPVWLREAAQRHAVPLDRLIEVPRPAVTDRRSPVEREIDDLLAECARRRLPYHGSRIAARDADYRDRLLAHLGRPPEGWGEVTAAPAEPPRPVEETPRPPAPDTLAARLAAAARAAGGSLSYEAQRAVTEEYRTEQLRRRLSEGSPEDRRWQSARNNQGQAPAPAQAPRARGTLPALDPGGPSERLRRLRGEGAE